MLWFFLFQAEDGIRDGHVTGVQTCALPISRGPRPVLTRATVIEAAIVIADSEGLSATSLRAIAGRLGVSVAGLYRYVAGKTELIALMVEHARREVVVAGRASTGREGLEDRAMADWDLYHRHAWLLDE